MFDDIKDEMGGLKQRLDTLRGHLDLSTVETELNELRNLSLKDDFWNHQAQAQETLKKISLLESQISDWQNVLTHEEDLDILLELALEDQDETLDPELQKSLRHFRITLEDYELRQLLSNADDFLNCIFTIHPGAGGTESQDWAEMLYRMYTRFFDLRGWTWKILDYLPGDEAGLKDATIEVRGDFAFGYLKAENGIHRLVRISPFDSNSRRHTSFASVYVYPLYDTEIEITIDMSEVRVDTYRASGAGGQHINKTDSAVRLTHGPTGVVVQCQNERSQHKNKETAMKMLKARLYTLEKEKEQAKMDQMASSKTEIGWGNQIRSYVFHPYTMVKDHRTKHETGNIQAVMNGEIDGFIKAYLLNQMGK
ncbi:MAG: peptide chain release factor 2 [Candidatus Marinimicrobia bacterium]|nr:peptide chain release factor 2 [Candidatus Neomarinimicrobiota bacterium]